MPISGLVITLAEDPQAAELAKQAVRGHPRFTCEAMPDPRRLPAVLDTPDRHTDREDWDWLNALDGVRQVDVVFIHFEDHDAAAEMHDGAAPTQRPALTPLGD